MLSFLFLFIQFCSRMWVASFAQFLSSTAVVSSSFSSLPSQLYFNEDELASAHVMVVRLSDRMLLYRKQEEDRIYPASLTKIMTALVALDSGVDLETRVRMDENQYSSLLQQKASMTGLDPGEDVTVLDLLYGVLLPSGADASVTLAQVLSGSEEQYVMLMNKKAKELGMTHTHFDNVTGLHSATHFTTVRDLVVLFETALKEPIFREIISRPQYQTTGSLVHQNGVSLQSTLFFYQQQYFMNFYGLLGGKTGYTPQAGLCLASWFHKNGQQYLMVTAQALKEEDQYPPLEDVQMVYQRLP